MKITATRLAIGYQLAAAVIFLLTLFAMHASAESGMNDDWSFVRTALDLANTGQIHYNGWSAPLIGFQAYWGALFIKVFGFSFLAVRASVVVLTVAAIPVLWSLFRSVGLTEAQAFFGLIAFLLSPLNLPDFATFMTDMPAFLLFAAALWAALKAWESESDNQAARWILAVTVFGLLSGSVRQVYWLSSVCFLGVLGIARMQSRKGRMLVVGCIALTLCLGWVGSHWLAQQPFVPVDTTVADWRALRWQEITNASGFGLARFLTGVAVLCLPISILFAREAVRRIPVWIVLLILGGSFGGTYFLAKPLPWLGNTLTNQGILWAHTVSAGEKPVILSPLAILVLSTTGLAAGILSIAQVFYYQWGQTGQTCPTPLTRLTYLTRPTYLTRLTYLMRLTYLTPLGRFVILTIPFLLGYLAVLTFRAPTFGLYDRYLIPAVFIIGTIALGTHARTHDKIRTPGWLVCIVFALYAIATTHDYFAETRAKLEASQEVLRAGNSRLSMMSGFEFDCWSQSEHSGHINSDQLHNDVYAEPGDCNGPDNTQMWWRSLIPDLKAGFVVTLSPLEELDQSNFKPVEYWRWLPLSKTTVYIQQIDPPLTCVN